MTGPTKTYITKLHKLIIPGRCKYTKNDVFDLVTQGQTELFSNLLKDFYYICGIKFQKNGSDVKYAVKNI